MNVQETDGNEYTPDEHRWDTELGFADSAIAVTENMIDLAYSVSLSPYCSLEIWLTFVMNGVVNKIPEMKPRPGPRYAYPLINIRS